mmetsp:Transcript_36233/g.108582  ORF Transcript_36233/g.108582 Transcript_36233/m.108582 type:complete len:121 (+) Transcript_36233:16-378(+)
MASSIGLQILKRHFLHAAFVRLFLFIRSFTVSFRNFSHKRNIMFLFQRHKTRLIKILGLSQSPMSEIALHFFFFRSQKMFSLSDMAVHFCIASHCNTFVCLPVPHLFPLVRRPPPRQPPS